MVIKGREGGLGVIWNTPYRNEDTMTNYTTPSLSSSLKGFQCVDPKCGPTNPDLKHMTRGFGATETWVHEEVFRHHPWLTPPRPSRGCVLTVISSTFLGLVTEVPSLPWVLEPKVSHYPDFYRVHSVSRTSSKRRILVTTLHLDDQSFIPFLFETGWWTLWPNKLQDLNFSSDLFLELVLVDDRRTDPDRRQIVVVSSLRYFEVILQIRFTLIYSESFLLVFLLFDYVFRPLSTLCFVVFSGFCGMRFIRSFSCKVYIPSYVHDFFCRLFQLEQPCTRVRSVLIQIFC